MRECVTPTQVVGLTPQKRGFRLILANGRRAIARRVVLATGAATPKIPNWAKQQIARDSPERLCHAQSVHLPTLSTLAGETVLIVGGGLTSAHLAIGALKRGAKVLLLGRSAFQEKIFDAEPGWLGPKYLKGFDAQSDWHTRWQVIQQARDGGSFTPEALTRLQKLSREGRLSLYEKCEITSAVWKGDFWRVKCSNSALHDCFVHQEINRICDLFLMGPWAALQVGPVARNLFGAKLRNTPLPSSIACQPERSLSS